MAAALALGVAPALPALALGAVDRQEAAAPASVPALAGRTSAARLAYRREKAALQGLAALKGDAERLAALLAQEGFPEDPLQGRREAFEAARAALRGALPAAADDEKDAVRAARLRLKEADGEPADESKDLELASNAYANLASAMGSALKDATKTPDEDPDPGATVAARVRAALAAAAGLGRFDALAARLKGKKGDPAAALAEARKTLRDLSAPLIDLSATAKKALDDDVATLRADLSADVDKRDAPAVVVASDHVAQARRRIATAILAADALADADGTFGDVRGMKAAGAALRASAAALRPYVELLDDRLGGANAAWEQAAIPVFYFGSVPRLMTALNLDAERFENAYFRDVDTGRAALLDAERARDVQRGEVSRLVSDLSAARERAARIRVKTLLDQANLDRLTRQYDRLGEAAEREKGAARRAALERDRTAIGKQRDDLATARAAGGARETAEAEALTKLEDASTAAAQALREAGTTLNALRLASAARAEGEVEAFREGVKRAPFWVSRARATSGDPVKQCEVFGYDDSLVVFVRGTRSNIDKVREVIRSFDRPTPQARLTLHTLQFNGTNPDAMRKASETVEAATVQLRGNLTVVQDVLRNAITKEVNRRGRVARAAIARPGNTPFTDRVYRGFYYPREIRETLGLRLRLPATRGADYLNNLVSRADDLESLEALFTLAVDRYHAFEQLNDGSARRRMMGEVEAALTQAEFLFTKLEEAEPAIQKAIKATAWTAMQALEMKGNALRAAFRGEGNLASVATDLKVILSKSVIGGTSPTTSYAQATFKQIQDVRAALVCEIEAEKNQGDEKFKIDDMGAGRVEFLTRYTLPDPVRGTTLGELLFVFSLGGQESRQRILHDFSAELLTLVQESEAELSRQGFEDYLERASEFTRTGQVRRGDAYGALGLASLAVSTSRLYGNTSENLLDVRTRDLFPYFPRTVFGGFAPRDNPGPSGDPLTANQKEILSAIEARVRAGVLGELRYRLSDKPDDDDLEQTTVLADYLQERTYRFKEDAADVDTLAPSVVWKARKLDGNDRAQWIHKVANRALEAEGTDATAGRVAAADDMIKRFVTVLEDDLQHFLVAPTLRSMREAVSGGSLKFGSFQTTSMLASNRGVARFDASAVATLGQDPEAGAQAIETAQQLGDLSSALGGVPGKLAGAAPFAAPLATAFAGRDAREDKLWKLGGLGLLGAALLLPDDDRPPAALYSLTSGGQFKVTPVLDPSGQALRFDLDYALVTRVQEPTNRGGVELPRIERQSLNIPVQVSNLDFRSVAGFESNAKIGVTAQRFGGLPFFKSLPVFRDIPLIGYFARSPGTPQVRQQTYVFVQSSIYPTVSDIVGLLVDAPLRASAPRSR